MTDQDAAETYERPIDRYPRVRDTGRWILRNGVTQFGLGLLFVYRAGQGTDPGLSALAAFVLGSSWMAAWGLTRDGPRLPQEQLDIIHELVLRGLRQVDPIEMEYHDAYDTWVRQAGYPRRIGDQPERVREVWYEVMTDAE